MRVFHVFFNSPMAGYKKFFYRLLICTFCCSPALASTDINIEELKDAQRFTTWQGVEPDKWATVWLIKRYLSQDAFFNFVQPNSDLTDSGYIFGVPEASLRRANKQSMFSRLVASAKIDNTAVTYLGAIINDIEVNIWQQPSHPHSSWLETMYRQLQARYNRDAVPVDCYLQFFDKVASLSASQSMNAEQYQETLSLTESCPGIKQHNGLVKSMTQIEVLREIGRGQNVVFVDTREDEEFAEVHIPGAILLRLREVNENTAGKLKTADLVVPYCVKDFRGFEVAKNLTRHGLTNVATLSPNGLKGWLNAKLPISKEGDSEVQSIKQLKLCAVEPKVCVENG